MCNICPPGHKPKRVFRPNPTERLDHFIVRALTATVKVLPSGRSNACRGFHVRPRSTRIGFNLNQLFYSLFHDFRINPIRKTYATTYIMGWRGVEYQVKFGSISTICLGEFVVRNMLDAVVKKHESRRSSESVRRLRISSFSMTPNKPFIRLHGMWLLAAGFHVSDEIDVQVHDRQLVIFPVSRLVASRKIHAEQRLDLVGHSAELPSSVSDRIIWSESDEGYTNL